MEEKAFSGIPIEKPKKDWLKIIFFSLTGSILLFGAFYAGYWYGRESVKLKTQSEKPQLKTQIQETPTPKLTPTSTPMVENETKDWNTLNFGFFSFKYPKDWINLGKTEGCGPAVRPTDTADYWVTICLFGEREPGTEINLEAEADRIAGLSSMRVLSPKEKTKIGSVDAVAQTVKDSSSNLFSQEVYFKGQQGLYTAFGYSRSEDLLRNYQLVFDQILSTFKFLD